MYLDPIRQQKTFYWLDSEWDRYKENPYYQQDMDIFLLLVDAFASNTDRAYIDAWYERYQQAQQKLVHRSERSQSKKSDGGFYQHQ